MCEISVLVFTQSACRIEANSHENIAITHACVTAKGIMDVYPDRSFYSTIAYFGKVNTCLPKHEKVNEVANVPVKIVHV